MDFSNEFEVQAPLETVWNAMLDVEQVAPCVPGATVLEQTGDDAYKVGIKVKVGPVTMNYRGSVEIVERDADAHRAVMTAKAREARGQGTATARVTMDLAESGPGTTGTIATHLKLSGKAAAMGAGVVQEVSAKITDQFATNLAKMLEGGPEPASESAAAASAQRRDGDGRRRCRGRGGDAGAEGGTAGAAERRAAAEEPAQQPAGVGARRSRRRRRRRGVRRRLEPRHAVHHPQCRHRAPQGPARRTGRGRRRVRGRLRGGPSGSLTVSARPGSARRRPRVAAAVRRATPRRLVRARVRDSLACAV